MPKAQQLMDHFFVKIGGDDLPAKIMDDAISITVDTTLHMPDMFTIHLHDEALQWVDDNLFALGAEVEILAAPESGGSSRSLIRGEITALEPDFGQGTQATLLIRGYDRSHRLHRGTHTRAFQQVTDSDLAKKLAQEVGLRVEVDTTTEVYDHIWQYNQSNMEFLTERARRIGYELFVADKTLYFRQPAQSDEALSLEWGLALQQFRPRLTLVEQVDQVVVKGWDPKTRQVIMGRAERGQTEPQLGQQQSGAQLAANAFSSARRTVVDRRVHSQTEAQTLAQAILDEISGAYIEADGFCYGQPGLRAGRFVTLTALGQRFSGTYFVTAATHLYRAGEGYVTEFSISGRRPETLHGLIEQAPASVEGSGAVIGIVTNNRDPEKRGRVKVKFPWLSEEVESDWARLIGLGAGPERGFFCLPEINDEVLVLFEQRDISRPYVVGGLWNGTDRPPAASGSVVENGRVRQRLLKTRAGHTFAFTDGPGEGMLLETAGGQRVQLNDDQQQIVLETAGGTRLTLDDGSNQVTLDSPGNLAIKAKAGMTIEAGNSLDIRARRVNINEGALEIV